MSENYNVPREEENESIIDIRELFQVVLSRALWIVLVVAVCLTAAFAYTKIAVKPQYRSNDTLYVFRGNGDTPSDVAMATYFAADFSEMITKHAVLDQVIENLSLDMSYGSLLSKIDISYNSESRIIDISVTDAYPMRAQTILEEVCRVAQEQMVTRIGATSITIMHGGITEAEQVGIPLARNMLLAGLVGLVGSVGVIVLIYILDDKIKSPDHIQRVLGVSTLGMIPYQRLQEETEGGEQ